MSLVSEYRNIQSSVILSFSRMSCWGSKSQTLLGVGGGYKGATGVSLDTWIYCSAMPAPNSHSQRWPRKTRKRELIWAHTVNGVRDRARTQASRHTPSFPLTCRLPRGQYSVRIQMLGGSVQAPTNLVKCSFCTSRICRLGQHQGPGRGFKPHPVTFSESAP